MRVTTLGMSRSPQNEQREGMDSRPVSECGTRFTCAALSCRVAIVVPTYNEAENLPELARRLFSLELQDLRLYIVDDGSPDGTADVARRLSVDYDSRIEVISRSGKLGLGTAYTTGFARALAEDIDYVVQMDADLSHVPEEIPQMLEMLDRFDVAVGSRYTSGGGLDPEWSAKRRMLSGFGNHLIRAVTGVRVKDVTSGFKAYRANALRSLDLTRIRCVGFGFQAEIAHYCQSNGLNVVEHPITFMERTRGESKMSIRIIAEAMWKLTLLRIRTI